MVTLPNPNKHSDAKKWSFAKKARLVLVLVFLSFLGFFTMCMTIGIVSNLHWHYADLDLPEKNNGSSSNLGSLEIRTCFTVLQNMHKELVDHVQEALWAVEDRDKLLKEWKRWSKDWKKRFEKLGIQCELTGLHMHHRHKALNLLVGIYQQLEYFKKRHTRFVRRYFTENAEALKQLHSMLQRAQLEIENLEGKPLDNK